MCKCLRVFDVPINGNQSMVAWIVCVRGAQAGKNSRSVGGCLGALCDHLRVHASVCLSVLCRRREYICALVSVRVCSVQVGSYGASVRTCVWVHVP